MCNLTFLSPKIKCKYNGWQGTIKMIYPNTFVCVSHCLISICNRTNGSRITSISSIKVHMLVWGGAEWFIKYKTTQQLTHEFVNRILFAEQRLFRTHQAFASICGVARYRIIYTRAHTHSDASIKIKLANMCYKQWNTQVPINRLTNVVLTLRSSISRRMSKRRREKNSFSSFYLSRLSRVNTQHINKSKYYFNRMQWNVAE